MSDSMARRPTSVPLLGAALAVAMLTSGCSLLGGRKAPPTQYAPPVQASLAASAPRLDAQLAIGPVQVARPYDSVRIAVRPTPQELQVYKDGTWAQRPSEMLTGSLLRLLEDSGRVRAVARAGAGVDAEYRLLLDIRRFEADYAGGTVPRATIEVSAKLLRRDDSDVVASKTFLEAEPAASTAVPQVVDAFDRALARIDGTIAEWTLTTAASAPRR